MIVLLLTYFIMVIRVIVCESIIDVEMSSLDTNIFSVSDGWSNGGNFDCYWLNSQVTFSGSYMDMEVDNDGCPASCGGKNYRAGEVSTKNKMGYGYFGAVIKIPKKAEGMMSGSVFTYDSSKDEIDIEFTGKGGGTQFDVNYWKAGVSTGNHKIINLDFDATEDFHEYGFVWTSTFIKWFVDGKIVHEATSNLPTNNMNFLVNIWPGNMGDSGTVSWLGTLDYQTPVHYQVKKIRYFPGLNGYPGEDKDGAISITRISMVVVWLAFLVIVF